MKYVLFVSLNISFMSVLNVLINRSFNTLLKFISKYFFYVIVNGIICISVMCFGVWIGK